MKTRNLLATVGALLASFFLAQPAEPQDLDFIRALERAQAQRPQALSSVARIAPEGEPGTPLVIHGRVVGSDGQSATAGAVVFAYHTDREGLYDQRSAGPHSWRLRGWVRTDAEGRFEFRTMRPGSYPSRSVPAHVHFTVFHNGSRFHAGELRFADDPLVSAREQSASERAGNFGAVRPVRQAKGVQHVDFAIRLDAGEKF